MFLSRRGLGEAEGSQLDKGMRRALLKELSRYSCFACLVTIVSYENGGIRVFSCFVRFLVKHFGINSEKCIEYGK